MRKCSECGRDCRYSLCRVCENQLKRSTGVTVKSTQQLTVRAVGGFVHSSERYVRGLGG